MRLSSRKFQRTKNIDLSMTAMIDVVFLLLIFFLSTTMFSKSEKQLVSAIQVDKEGEASRARDLEPAVVDVWNENSKVFYRLGAVVSTDEAEVSRSLNEFKFKSEGAFVRIGDGVPFENVARLISNCKAAGFEQVTYVPNSK